MDDGFLDFDLSQNTQLSPRPHLAPILSIFPGSQVPVSNPTAQYPLIPGSQGPQPMVIGKQSAPMSQHWVCFGGSYACDLSHCGQQFPNLPALEQHFATFHARVYGQYYTWGCINCQYQVSYLSAGNHCVQCQKSSLWEMWYWGTVDSPSGPPSAVPGLSISQDESPSGPSSQTSHSAHHPDPSTTYNNAYMPSSGGYGYGYGGGQSYYKSAPAAPTTDAKHTCHPCPPLMADMCLSKFSSHLKTGEKPVFLWRVCPPAIVLAVFVLALVARVVSPSSKPFADGVDPVVWNLLLWPLMRNNGRPSVPQLSVACIATGLAGTWLFCHVRDKMTRQEEEVQVCPPPAILAS